MDVLYNPPLRFPYPGPWEGAVFLPAADSVLLGKGGRQDPGTCTPSASKPKPTPCQGREGADGGARGPEHWAEMRPLGSLYALRPTTFPLPASVLIQLFKYLRSGCSVETQMKISALGELTL